MAIRIYAEAVVTIRRGRFAEASVDARAARPYLPFW